MKMMKKFAAALAAVTVASVSVASMAVSAIDSKEEPPYTAYLCISAGTDQQWEEGDLEGESATITGDGDYRASVTIPNGSATIELLLLDTNINAYAFVAEGGDPLTEGTAKIAVKSIQVEHVSGTTDDIVFTEDPSCLRMSDNGSSLRFTVLDQWTSGTKVACIGSEVPGGLAAGDKVVMNFTVSGISAGGGTAETTAPEGNGDPDTTTTAATNPDGSAATTAAGGNNSSGNSSSGNSSSGSSNKSSGSSNSSTSNDKTSETGDFGIAAVVLGAIATAALGAGAYTVTRRKK
ncbi:MAG: hypothetical protein ACI4XB_03865 [Ruminococcus sp.]